MAGINLKSERNHPWFKPWFNILLHTQSIVFATVSMSILRVLGIYNFELCSVCTLYMSPFNMICHILTSSSHQSVICLNVIVYLESLFANRGNCSMVMFKRELASNDKIRVNNRGCSLYRVSPIELKFLTVKKAPIQTVRNLVFHCQEVVGNAD